MSRPQVSSLQQPGAHAPLAVNEREAAKMLCVSPRTLFNWRKSRIGPPYVRLNNRILYAVDAMKDWLITMGGKNPS